MLTRWGREVDPHDPWPEHPRPQLVREGWRTLNGRWEVAFRADPTPPTTYDDHITVPFSPETELAGLRFGPRQVRPQDWLFYRRVVDLAPRPGRRLLLHFGAVDQDADVWLAGRWVGGHSGGYLPFTLDVTDAARTGVNELVVRVRDRSETVPYARGKQRLDRGAIWYTAQSGIWQTVWLEEVPEVFVADLVLTPYLASEELEVLVRRPTTTTATADTTATVTATATATVTLAGATHRIPTDRPIRLPVPGARPWTPADPHLYDVQVTLGEDQVSSYAAMRSLGVRDGRLLLNGQPFQHVGLLDQGYWPDGLLTPPSDAAMVYDIETMRGLGLTAVRKHAKIEPLRWYHHCDRLGLLVWQDMVNGGGRYRWLTTQLPATRIGRHLRWPDRLHRLYQRGDAAGRTQFQREVGETVALLRSSPCVAVWTTFNEGWGQFDAVATARRVRWLDPTRQVSHADGWVDQGGGDIDARHCYFESWRAPRRRRDHRVLALTEYGGYSLHLPGHAWSEEEFGYRSYRTVSALADAWERLHREEIEPSVREGVAATFYTQLTDVEEEVNGLLTWDREVLKIDPETVRAAVRRMREQAQAPGSA